MDKRWLAILPLWMGVISLVGCVVFVRFSQSKGWVSNDTANRTLHTDSTIKCAAECVNLSGCIAARYHLENNTCGLYTELFLALERATSNDVIMVAQDTG